MERYKLAKQVISPFHSPHKPQRFIYDVELFTLTENAILLKGLLTLMENLVYVDACFQVLRVL